MSVASGGDRSTNLSDLPFEYLNELYANAVVDRRRELIFVYGSILLKNHQSQITRSELYNILEQVALVSIEYGDDHWSQYCLSQLEGKFPNAARVKRLQAFSFESNNDISGAVKYLTDLLTKKPDDIQARRRLVDLQRRLPDRVELLNRHLTEFCTDFQAWQELGNIYMRELQLSKAIFCFEEILLHNPISIYTILTLAQLYYSTRDIPLSRKYHCLALGYQESNPRALWGLLFATLNTAGSTRKANSKKSQTATGEDKACVTRNSSQGETSQNSAAEVSTQLMIQAATRLSKFYENSILTDKMQKPTFQSVAIKVIKKMSEGDVTIGI